MITVRSFSGREASRTLERDRIDNGGCPPRAEEALVLDGDLSTPPFRAESTRAARVVTAEARAQASACDQSVGEPWEDERTRRATRRGHRQRTRSGDTRRRTGPPSTPRTAPAERRGHPAPPSAPAVVPSRRRSRYFAPIRFTGSSPGLERPISPPQANPSEARTATLKSFSLRTVPSRDTRGRLSSKRAGLAVDLEHERRSGHGSRRSSSTTPAVTVQARRLPVGVRGRKGLLGLRALNAPRSQNPVVCPVCQRNVSTPPVTSA